MEPFVKWAGGKRQLLEKLNARISVLSGCLGAGAINNKARRKMKKELKELIKYAKQ